MNAGPVLDRALEQSANGCALQYSLAPTITASEFARRSETEEWVIVDVRSDIERRVSTIPGALSSEEFETQLDSHRGKPILVYCTVGCRSGAYAQMLRDSGFDAFSLWGGILAWSLEGRRFSTPEGRATGRVHVSSPNWNMLPRGYQAVW